MIYLDNNATTRLSEEVLETMLPYLRDEYGNASSIQHKLGRNAKQAIEKARYQVAQLLQVQDNEIIFTSGSTEAINMVIKGIYERYRIKGKHIITCQTEHKAVLNTCEYLERQGADITYLPVGDNGQINPNELSLAIRPDTILVTLMAANNETGVLFPIEQIAHICQEKDVLFFCDATQYVGKASLDLSLCPIDILCLSAHKFHGPKGIGALYVRRKSKPIQISPLLHGGKQEHGLRGGTYPVANIVGLGKAAASASGENERIRSLRDFFEQSILRDIEEVHIHATTSPRLYNTSNVLFRHVRSAELMTKLSHVAISSGSACVSGDRDPSHVLKAMGLSDEDAFCSLRFSFSKYNTQEEIEQVINDVKETVLKIRSQSPIWQMYKAGLLE
ncbi:cysteine desulfurase [Parapedobacter sp. SGR-10]|uniref:cysteine desulfurase family protein n=1 Tax=Parapedobacter sp. SGR-10 TaxID=2710879 RepID=UPI0013D02368|nr:cysteine desulfurase family protein [Parapedobacter sp. SGR-10]NGF57082.1 cysteine desulfurase [Parapedobacter sp. SGR-10]